jgi:broad specificity phosphatase PhoE
MNILFVRHGQAGTRRDYDVLSGLGCEQSTLLGRYLDGANWRFACWYAGGLRRQQETAQLASIEQKEAVATTKVEESWNEFDLDAVYEGIGPQLALRNPEFRTHWQTVKTLVDLHGENEAALVNRRWSPADEMVVRAWVNGDFRFDGETWLDFRERIRGSLKGLLKSGLDSAVVFTSATPIAICVGEALGLPDSEIFQLAGSLMNSSFSELRFRHNKLRMFTFNNTPHLNDAALRTHR